MGHRLSLSQNSLLRPVAGSLPPQNTPLDDVVPPTLEKIQVAHRIDVDKAHATLPIELRIVDDGSGIAAINLMFTGSSGQSVLGWTAYWTFSPYLAPGQWRVESLHVRDFAGNGRSYSARNSNCRETPRSPSSTSRDSIERLRA